MPKFHELLDDMEDGMKSLSYSINLERAQESHVSVNYNFLVKLYSELKDDQKLKFSKILQSSNIVDISKVG